MMRKVILILAICFVSSIYNYSQSTGEFKGTVRDKNSKEPIENVAVQIMQNGSPIDGGFTDDKGTFWLLGIPNGTYSVLFSGPNYGILTKDNVVIRTGQITYEEFEMTPTNGVVLDTFT